jgi:hypothetical protein
MRVKRKERASGGKLALFGGGGTEGRELFRELRNEWIFLCGGDQAALRSVPKVAGAIAGRLTFEPGPPRGG